jgi:hypothetical protein
MEMWNIEGIEVTPVFADDNLLITSIPVPKEETIIYDFFFKFYQMLKSGKIAKCNDCNRFRKVEDLEETDACADGCCGFGNCCFKTVCRDECVFKVYCNNCDKTFKKEFSGCCRDKVEAKCDYCQDTIEKDLLWWGMSCQEYCKKYGM